MNVIQTIALTIIAVVLALDLWSSQFRPQYHLRENRDELNNLSIKCEAAKAAMEQIAIDAEGIDDAGFAKLQAATRVELVSCHEREKLRQHMLSKGVRSVLYNNRNAP